MNETFTCDEARALDRTALERYGIPGILLMENAARAAADVVTEYVTSADSTFEKMTSEDSASENVQNSWEILIFCGTGNNAGDGFAMARHFQTRLIPVRIVLCADPVRLKGDALFQYELVRKLEIPMVSLYDASSNSQVLQRLESVFSSVEGRAFFVDAMLGTGASGPPRFPMSAAIPWLNHCCKNGLHPLFSVDVPTGLNADTGEGWSDDENQVIHAAQTVTMAVSKRGFTESAKKFTGSVRIVDLGVSVSRLQ